MKEIDYLELYISVQKWILKRIKSREHSICETENFEKTYYLTCELLKLFVKKSTNLFYISHDSTKFENINITQKSMLFENCFNLINLTVIHYLGLNR